MSDRSNRPEIYFDPLACALPEHVNRYRRRLSSAVENAATRVGIVVFLDERTHYLHRFNSER